MLILIGEDIYPTNEKCWSFQEYATNCVSQSNSKRAREERLLFFEKLLLNQIQPSPDIEDSGDLEIIFDIINYYDIKNASLREVQGYYLIDIYEILKIKTHIRFYDEI